MTSTTSALRASKALRRASWYLHRARAMPPQELPFRVTEQARRALGRRPTRSARRPTPRTDTTLSDLVLHWGSAPGVAEHWAQRAAEVSRGEVIVFGTTWSMSPDGVPDWDLDPVTGFRWPQDYCFDVPLVPSSADPVEVKYVWELNRLLYLLPVAAHAALTRDEQAAELCRAHLRSWIDTHPARRGVTWRSGIELAHRILVLVVVLELTAFGRGADPELEELVGRSVAEHADWVHRFPSRFSSANNHRVTELVGLLVAADAYPGLLSDQDLELCWTEFETVVPRQFHPDGVSVEQATMYAFEVVEWVSVGLRIAHGQGRPVVGETRERLTAAAEFLAAVTDRRGNPVRIGDDDDSRLLTAALPPDDVAEAVLGLATAELELSPRRPAAGLSTFVEGGYSVWRSGSAAEEVLWVIDHGPLGMGHLAAHAHADTLAVFLHVGGRPVFVDAGTYLYHSGGVWRDQFRRTAEHNTVAVAGQDSSLMAGAFSWRREHRAEGRLLAASSSGSTFSLEAEHHGYAKRHGVVHRRVLEGTGPRTFRITDDLRGGSGGVSVRWSLLLAPDLSVVRTVEGWAVSRDGAEVATLVVPPQLRASLDEEAGWFSPAFGHLERSCRLLIEGTLPTLSSICVEVRLSRP